MTVVLTNANFRFLLNLANDYTELFCESLKSRFNCHFSYLGFSFVDLIFVETPDEKIQEYKIRRPWRLYYPFSRHPNASLLNPSFTILI